MFKSKKNYNISGILSLYQTSSVEILYYILCYIFFIVNNLNVYICVCLHAAVERIVCCLMTIQPLDFKSMKSYIILSYLNDSKLQICFLMKYYWLLSLLYNRSDVNVMKVFWCYNYLDSHKILSMLLGNNRMDILFIIFIQ